jgi:predicted transcriptional regulator
LIFEQGIIIYKTLLLTIKKMQQAELKQELIEWLSELDDTAIVTGIKFIKDSYEHNLKDWESLSEHAKQGIERGLKDIEEGRVIPHEVIKKKYGIEDSLVK